MCPLCLMPAPLNFDGSLGEHDDEDGHPCTMIGRQPWDERATRAAVKSRSNGICEYCPTRRAAEMHHRINRSVGGRWTPAGIVHLCSPCHRRVTINPEWACSVGLSVKSWGELEEILVTRLDGSVFQPTSNVSRPR